MSPFVRMLLWGLICAGLLFALQVIPKPERDIRIFFDLSFVLWLILSGLWLIRGIFRFVTR